MIQLKDVLPCPFCGSTNVFAAEGSTFRWWVAECGECSAKAGEVRRQTSGDGSNFQWDNDAAEAARRKWNERVSTEARGDQAT